MSLFGASTQNTQQSNAGSLFGAKPNTGGGLFGQTGNQNTSGFGNTTTPTTGGGLFGASNNQASTTTNSLFGNNNTATNTNTSLFGNNNASNTSASPFGNNQNTSNNAGSSLFGNNNAAGASNNTANATNNTSLFGGLNSNNNTASNTGSLFGNPGANAGGAQNSGTTGGLFGGSLNNAPNTQNVASSALGGNRASIFGTTTQPVQSSNFGAGATSINQPQNNQITGLQSSLYQPQNVPIGSGAHSITQSQLQRLQMSGLSTVPNEKSIADQIQTIYRKWNPSPENGMPSQTILRTYFYNAIEKAYAPFVYPAAGEDERSWEEALSKKPEIPKVDGQDPNMTYVPSQCVGFFELSLRLEKQAQTVQSMRARLHEMNNSLSAIMDAHQQRLVVKIAAARRQHQVLAQRCLRLATKVQVLRNRGYALDAAEEELRRTLLALEGDVMNPALHGREDDIWARLVSLRERTRWLEEESGKVSAQLNAQGVSGNESKSGQTAVPEGVLVKTRKILKDYGDQLGHLNRELEDVKKEYNIWQDSQKQ